MTKMLLLALPLLAACAAEAEPVDDGTAYVIGGTATNARPEIGFVTRDGAGICTATLARPDVIISAAHCFEGSGALRGYAFATQNRRFTIDFVHSFLTAERARRSDWRDYDIVVARLTTAVPAGVARPMTLARSWPGIGSRIAVYGYGCSAAGGNDFGTKRSREYRYTLGMALDLTSTDALCPGDSGGPLVDLDRNVLLGIHSGGGGSGGDWFGDVPQIFASIDARARELRR